MEAVAHNPAFAKKVGIPRSVGEDFSKADKGKTFKKGGEMKKKMASGGETMGPRSMKEDVVAGSNKHGKFGESKLQKKGHTRGRNLGDTGPKEPIESEKNMKGFMKKYAKGGKVKRYDDGGDVETETAQGQNANIGDDTRARAMAALQSGKMDQEVPTPKPRMKARPKSNAMTRSMSNMNPMGDTYKKGGMTKKMAGGGSASSRADGIAQRGKTRGKYC